MQLARPVSAAGPRKHLKAPDSGCVCIQEACLSLAQAPDFEKPLCALAQRLRKAACQPIRAPRRGRVGSRRESADGTCCKRSVMRSALVSWLLPSSNCCRAARSADADLSTESGKAPERKWSTAKRLSGCSGEALGVAGAA